MKLILIFMNTMKKIQVDKNQNPLEEYSVTIYEIDPYFYEHYEKNTS